MYFDLGKENFHLTSKLLNINNNATLTKQYNHDDLISVINKSDVCSVCCLPMLFRKSSWRRVFVPLITIRTFDQEIRLLDWVGNGVYICVNSNMFQCEVIQQFNSLSICYFLKLQLYLNTGEQFLQCYIQIHIEDNDGCDLCPTFADTRRNKCLWWVTNTLYKCIQGVIVFSFMQFRTGIPRIGQSKSYTLLLTKYAWIGILKYFF